MGIMFVLLFVVRLGVANKSTTRIKGGAIRGDYGGRNSIEMMGTPGYITPVGLAGFHARCKHDSRKSSVASFETLSGWHRSCFVCKMEQASLVCGGTPTAIFCLVASNSAVGHRT